MSDINTNRTPPARNSSLELLRIFAAMFVIMVHYNNAGSGGGFLYTESLPLHHQILLVFEMMGICAVNIFVMISGYFLCTSRSVRISKVVQLYMDVIVLALVRYVLNCVPGGAAFTVSGLLRCFIPLNWYVAVYAGLYLISPYLNQILQNKSRAQFRFLIGVFFLLFAVWPSGVEFLSKALDFSPSSLSPISNQGSGDGYTLINFILMYFLGAYCRKYGEPGDAAKKRVWSLLVYFGCVAVNTVYANFFLGRATSYCNPLVIIQTVAIFVFFQNLSVSSRVINTIAGCSFGVYLLHASFFRYCRIERFVTGNPLLIPVHIIATAILIYAVSGLIYWIYRKAFAPVSALLHSRLAFLTYDANGFVRESHQV